MDLNSEMKPMRRFVEGFTLVEALLLLVIVGLLLFLIVPALNRLRHARSERAAVVTAPGAPATEYVYLKIAQSARNPSRHRFFSPRHRCGRSS